MSTLLLTLYVLVWPALVAGTLWVIVRAFFGDWRRSREEGRSII